MSISRLSPVAPEKIAKSEAQRAKNAKEHMTDPEGRLYEFYSNITRVNLPEAFSKPEASAKLNAYHKYYVLQRLGFTAMPDIAATDMSGRETTRAIPVYASVDRGGRGTVFEISRAMDELAEGAFFRLPGDVDPTPFINPADMMKIAREAVATVLPNEAEAWTQIVK